MNSLDIVPNSLAQVAAAIAEKRSRSITRRPSFDPPALFTQGQAFSAGRRHSISHEAGFINSDQINDLTRELDNSPRKIIARDGTGRGRLSVSQRQSSLGLRAEGGAQFQDVPRCHRRHASSVSSVPRLPRIQISTSGLGFSDTDFDVSPVRFNKVAQDESQSHRIHGRNKHIMSEKERRQMKLQQELSGARRRSRERQAPWGWRNVAAEGTDVHVRHTARKGKAVWVDQ